MDKDPFCVEQPRVLCPEATRAGGVGRTTDSLGGAPAQLVVVVIDAVESADEEQRLGLTAVSRESLRVAPGDLAAEPTRGELADQDRVATVAGGVKGLPGGA